MADKLTTFQIEINGGKTQTIETKKSEYVYAALASLALFEYEHVPGTDYDVVKIWCEELLPDYGPYYYGFDGFNVGLVAEDRKW